ncbi:CAF17-like 4Fe-4S cluster assembly/insertion protein YgfZ [Gulosibacter molinativorax]|uniref:CAF17-like 4Fe-4S cluster assembly/insertion protein YgfZ n=1 Tax=Gulosibacter molinativorax TaxID=256821 RepID=UPI00041CA313|nr:folate-binding protein [Gulosibacter molinativorax]QUY63850.1 Glycine cleavage T-protein [Gulosibacter molinativorax]
MKISESPFLGLPGAVAAAAPDAGVAAHYGGTPLREQRQLARGLAIVDCSHLGIIEVSGEDRLTWIDSLTTQSIANIQPGESAENLLLSPQGRIEFAFGMLDDGASTWLISEPDLAAGLAEWLHKMRFRMRVVVTDRSADLFAIGTLGAQDLGAVAPGGVPLVWHDPWTTGVEGAVSYAAIDPAEHPGHDFGLSLHLVDAAGREALVERVRSGELEAAGAMALNGLRVAAWRPRQAYEFDDRIIPHELDLLRSAVHLNKGCYRGQETIAKVHNLGHPPRRLVQLDLEGTDGRLPAKGALVHLGSDPDGKPVGRVTSAVMHYESGPIALALLKRAVDPTAELVVELSENVSPVEDVQPDAVEESPIERLAAFQTVIVSPESGRAVSIPRGLRRK